MTSHKSLHPVSTAPPFAECSHLEALEAVDVERADAVVAQLRPVLLAVRAVTRKDATRAGLVDLVHDPVEEALVEDLSEAYKRGRIKKQKYNNFGFGGMKRPF